MNTFKGNGDLGGGGEEESCLSQLQKDQNRRLTG